MIAISRAPRQPLHVPAACIQPIVPRRGRPCIDPEFRLCNLSDSVTNHVALGSTHLHHWPEIGSPTRSPVGTPPVTVRRPRRTGFLRRIGVLAEFLLATSTKRALRCFGGFGLFEFLHPKMTHRRFPGLLDTWPILSFSSPRRDPPLPITQWAGGPAEWLPRFGVRPRWADTGSTLTGGDGGRRQRGWLRLEITNNGRGGANPHHGSGLSIRLRGIAGGHPCATVVQVSFMPVSSRAGTAPTILGWASPERPGSDCPDGHRPAG